jgi:hypothetical protein
MKAVVSSKRPCVLVRGEMRRVPQDRSYKGIVGYHVCCPRCGFVRSSEEVGNDISRPWKLNWLS